MDPKSFPDFGAVNKADTSRFTLPDEEFASNETPRLYLFDKVSSCDP